MAKLCPGVGDRPYWSSQRPSEERKLKTGRSPCSVLPEGAGQLWTSRLSPVRSPESCVHSEAERQEPRGPPMLEEDVNPESPFLRAAVPPGSAQETCL